MYNSFIILYRGQPIVNITDLPDLFNPVEILEYYAEFSGFSFEDLTFIYVNKLSFNELGVL